MPEQASYEGDAGGGDTNIAVVKSFLNGGTGGAKNYGGFDPKYCGNGGFGGGGGGMHKNNQGSGGGGGYGGGGAGHDHSAREKGYGGGGGSFCSGSNRTQRADNSGSGWVSITFVRDD